MKKWIGVLATLVIGGILVGLLIVPAVAQGGVDSKGVITVGTPKAPFDPMDYDKDSNGQLSRQESLLAALDFFDGLISIKQTLQVVVLFIQGGDPAIIADYGDAPDGTATGYPDGYAQIGNFPTLYASNGARTLDVSGPVLGGTATKETDADDPIDPDGRPNIPETDSDDGLHLLNGFKIDFTKNILEATMVANVSAPADSGTGIYYLNALIDIDMDGSWGGLAYGDKPEWVVQNEVVNIIPGGMQIVTPDAFPYCQARRVQPPDASWMRVALTDTPIMSPDWSGTGQFNSGEIEDHLVRLNDPGSPTCILAVDCGSPTNVYMMPPNQQNCHCDVYNFGYVPCNWDWDASMVTVDGAVDVIPFNGVCQGIAARAVGKRFEKHPVGINVVGTKFKEDKMPCVWRVGVGEDPLPKFLPDGLIAGRSEASATIEFVQETANPPTIACNDETDFILFEHYHTHSMGCPIEEIATFELTNVGSGSLSWEIRHPFGPGLWPNDGWLLINPVSGTAPTTVTLSFDCAESFGTGGMQNFPIFGQDPGSGLDATNSGDMTVSVWWYED